MKLWLSASEKECGSSMNVVINLEKVKEAVNVLRDGITAFAKEYEVRINGEVIIIRRIFDNKWYMVELPYVPVVALMLLEKYVEAKDYYSELAKKIESGVWE